MGNALVHGEHCFHGSDENYQRAHDERPFSGWSNRLPEKPGIWHIQQRSAVASYALFFHRPSDRCDVFRGTVAFEGGAACYGWDAHGWHGGPLTQNQDFIYQAGLMMIGTDAVAMDTIELEKIEAKRSKEGAPSVWSREPKSITENGFEFYQNAAKNLFYRQPHHIAAAGKLGLGISDLKRIDQRSIRIPR